MTDGQLCWSNTSLIEHITENVKQFLRSSPNATIISVSQNDNHNYCQSPAEMQIIEAEGSPMGPLLRAVNRVADSILPEFPHVAVDTLAYQYTRPAPNTTVPRSNVMCGHRFRLSIVYSGRGALTRWRGPAAAAAQHSPLLHRVQLCGATHRPVECSLST